MRTYQPKFLDDGSPNPRFKSQPNYHPHKWLEDGRPNPDWKPRASGPRTSGRFKPRPFSECNFFTAWDGEGVDTPEGHQYILISAGWKRGKTAWQYRDLVAPPGERLTTLQILDFMAEVVAQIPQKGHHVSYSFGYDAVHILRDLDWPEAKYALMDSYKRRGWVGKNSVKYTPRKLLSVWFPQRAVGGSKHWSGLLRLWDVFGFFQSSFVSAVEDWLGPDYPDLGIIREGKGERGTQADRERLTEYCHAELRALVLMMEKVFGGFKEMGLSLKRWDGPGAAASAAFRLYMPKDWFEVAREPLASNQALYQAAQHAYFGGRVEMIRYGCHRGDLYLYDLNSAYPAALVQLPDLSAGEWQQVKTPTSSVAVCQVKWVSGQTMIGPFPLRRAKGTVVYPLRGIGWYWWPEVEAAIASGAEVEIMDCWQFVPRDPGARPFSWVADLYARRQVAIQRGEGGLQKAIKLVINSLYGKTAQQVGYIPRLEQIVDYRRDVIEEFDNGLAKVPPYYNLVVAGWITSWCRAQVARAAGNGEGIIAIATDGVVSTQPLDLEVDTVKKLGGWSLTFEEDATFVLVQSGVYYTRTREGVWKERSRGFTYAGIPSLPSQEKAKLIARRVQQIMDGWERGDESIAIPGKRLVTLRAAAAGEEPSAAWEKRGQWEPLPQGRVIHLFSPQNSPKRVPLGIKQEPHLGLVDTWPWEDFHNEFPVSYPYHAIPLNESIIEIDQTLSDEMAAWLEHGNTSELFD